MGHTSDQDYRQSCRPMTSPSEPQPGAGNTERAVMGSGGPRMQTVLQIHASPPQPQPGAFSPWKHREGWDGVWGPWQHSQSWEGLWLWACLRT